MRDIVHTPDPDRGQLLYNCTHTYVRCIAVVWRRHLYLLFHYALRIIIIIISLHVSTWPKVRQEVAEM